LAFENAAELTLAHFLLLLHYILLSKRFIKYQTAFEVYDIIIPQMGKESLAAREAEARRRAMARKKAIDYQTRAMRLHLGAPKLPRGRQNVDIQTDVHLEEVRIVKLHFNVCVFIPNVLGSCGKKLNQVR